MQQGERPKYFSCVLTPPPAASLIVPLVGVLGGKTLDANFGMRGPNAWSEMKSFFRNFCRLFCGVFYSKTSRFLFEKIAKTRIDTFLDTRLSNWWLIIRVSKHRFFGLLEGRNRPFNLQIRASWDPNLGSYKSDKRLHFYVFAIYKLLDISSEIPLLAYPGCKKNVPIIPLIRGPKIVA